MQAHLCPRPSTSTVPKVIVSWSWHVFGERAGGGGGEPGAGAAPGASIACISQAPTLPDNADVT